MMGTGRQAIELTERDLRLLSGLFDARVMTLGQVSALYFDERSEAAKKRVQKLKADGIIRERPRRLYEPSVLFLGKKALRHLRDHGHLDPYPEIGATALEKRAQVSQTTLQHELAVQDVRVAFTLALQNLASFSIVEFSTWPLLFQFNACPGVNLPEVLVKPDGFISLHEQSDSGDFEHTFFLEVDRSSETLDRLTARSFAYIDYYRSGGFAVRNGADRESFKDYPFRVLMVLKTKARRDNVAAALLRLTPPILSQIWLGVMDDVLAHPLDRVWLTPEAHRSTGELRSIIES